MSLASIASSLSSVRDRIRAALTSKGLNVSSGVTLNQTADLIEALPSSGAVDVTSTTAQAADVRAGRIFVNSGGVQVSGTMPDAAVTSNSSGVTVSSGYLSSSVHIDPVVSSGGTEVTLGYITSGGEFQALTFSGTNATNNGSAITLSCYTWHIPDTSGGTSGGTSGNMPSRPVTSNTSSGAVASGVVEINVSSGWKYVDAAVRGCSMTVYDGGLAENTAVSAGVMHISSGGWADSTTVTIRGQLIVYNGGMANSAIASGDSCGIYVSSGGMAMYASNLTVCDGGYANSVSGRLYVSSGGTAEIVSATSLTVEHGGIVSRTEMNYVSGAMDIYGRAVDTLLISGTMLIRSGGTAEIVSARGSNFNLYIESGGSADIVNINGGNSNDVGIEVDDGGKATNVNLSNCRCKVYSGGIVDSVTVKYNGTLYVSGTATNIIVESGGTLSYADGAVVSSVVSSAGAVIQ